MKNIAIEITLGAHTTGVVIDAAQAASMYSVLSALLHGFDVQIVDIPAFVKVTTPATIEGIFNMVEEEFKVQISFQVCPLLKGSPKFNNCFSSYETAKEMSQLWKESFQAPYIISSKIV